MKNIKKAGGEIFFDIQQGDTVNLISGGFSGYQAIFEERLNGHDRVRVLIKMLSDRYVSVEVDAGTIKKQE